MEKLIASSIYVTVMWGVHGLTKNLLKIQPIKFYGNGSMDIQQMNWPLFKKIY